MFCYLLSVIKTKVTLKSYRRVIDDVPFQFAVAKDFIENVQLLEICKDLITWADFCLFDVSTWNANVTLELGLADGMKKNITFSATIDLQ